MKPENAPRLEDWMAASEVAQHLSVSRTTVNEMIRDGEFKTLHLFGSGTKRAQYMIKREEVEQMAETRTFPRRPEIGEEE